MAVSLTRLSGHVSVVEYLLGPLSCNVVLLYNIIKLIVLLLKLGLDKMSYSNLKCSLKPNISFYIIISCFQIYMSFFVCRLLQQI